MIKTSIGEFNTTEEAINAFEQKIKPKESPKSKLLFVLTMPNVGSWNGKWTGASNLYAKIKDGKSYPNCKEGNYYYRWDDGWGANVSVERVTAKESHKYSKASRGFCNYDWMIESILHYGEIKTQ